MFIALDSNTNERLCSLNISGLIDKKIICPICKMEVLFVNSVERKKHFRHKVECDCINCGESEEHMKMKQFLYNFFFSEFCSIDFEVPLNNEKGKKFRQADIAGITKNGIEVSIECQCSNISKEEIIKRTKDHNKSGRSVLWIINKELLNSSLNSYRVNVSESLRLLHRWYFGRIYVYDDGKIFPVHFFSNSKVEYNSYKDDVYERFYKTKRDLFCGRIVDNPIFTKFENTVDYSERMSDSRLDYSKVSLVKIERNFSFWKEEEIKRDKAKEQIWFDELDKRRNKMMYIL